jgi:hypothetical protein
MGSKSKVAKIQIKKMYGNPSSSCALRVWGGKWGYIQQAGAELCQLSSSTGWLRQL